MKYIVYQTTNKINGKIFVGVSKTEDPNVFDGYLGNGIKRGEELKYPKTVYQYAVKKYGYNNFTKKILFIYDTIEEAYKKLSEIVNDEWIKSNKTYNTFVIKYSDNQNKKLYRFDYKGNLFNVWDSYYDVIENYGKGCYSLQNAIKNKTSLYESYWSYDSKINLAEYSKIKQEGCFQFDEDGNLIKYWETVNDAAKELKVNSYSIHEAIRIKKIFKKCWWCLNKDGIYHTIKFNELFNLNNKSVLQYDKDHNLISEFNSIKEATKILHIKYQIIKKGIKSKSLVDNKFYFEWYTPKRINKKVNQFDLNKQFN